MRLTTLHLVLLIAAATLCRSSAFAQTATHAGHSYTLIMTQNVADARAQAAAMGGYLVSITNQAENDFLLQTFSGASGDFFIGLSDEQSEGVYSWESGQATVYTNWFGGHPVAGPSNYSKFLLSSGKWASGNGTIARPAVVEIEPKSGQFGGHRYLLISAQNHADARSQAATLGGYLASIGSPAENDFLVQTFSGATGNDIYIGFSDEIDEGSFLWDSGEPVSFTNWQSGQPQGGGDYGKLLLNSGEWTAGAGTDPNPAIVEFGSSSKAIYFDDFESGGPGWTSTGLWDLGVPAQQTINTAFSGTKVIMTGLTYNYPSYFSNNWEYVTSPVIDLSAVTNDPIVRFGLIYETEFEYDLAQLQVKTGSGDWEVVDFETYHDGGFGLPGWSGSSSGWVEEETVVPGIAGESSVRFRFLFFSDASIDDEGVAFDDFAILDRIHYERNTPAATLHFDGVESDGLEPAITVTPDLALLSLESTLTAFPYEMFVSFGPIQPCGAAGSIEFLDGQCVNMDATNPSFGFLYGGGAMPAFQPMANATIPIPSLIEGFEVSAQLIILDITSPIGVTLSQAATLRNAPLPATIRGPWGDDQVKEIDLPYVTFFGTSYDTLFMDSNGRLGFGSPPASSGYTPNLAAQDSPFVGVWADLNPWVSVAGIFADVTETTFTMTVVDAPYRHSGTPVNFSITINLDHHQSPGVITLAGLSGLAPSNGPIFLGMSPGGGASDPGPTTFATAASGGGFLATDMIYDSSNGTNATLPTSLLGGLDEIVFTPLGGSYTWMGL